MILYYEDEEATIEAIKKYGPVVVLTNDGPMSLCDRSLLNEGPADEPLGTPIPDGFTEMTFNLKADVKRFEVIETDAPAGRHFSLTASELEALRII